VWLVVGWGVIRFRRSGVLWRKVWGGMSILQRDMREVFSGEGEGGRAERLLAGFKALLGSGRCIGQGDGWGC